MDSTDIHGQFYCCYLLESAQNGLKSDIYIGSTPDPIRRLRQHNGEIQGGAKKTAKKRPCIVIIIAIPIIRENTNACVWISK